MFDRLPRRRAFLRQLCGCCGGLVGLHALHACSDTTVAERGPGVSPALNSDEAGLRAALDKAEAELKTSPRRMIDPEINAYVSSIACKLGERHCGEIRVYVVRAPFFNASMAPNGMMQLWTGALLRMENEAQLATVMSHEIAHYLQSHAIKNWRRRRNNSTIGALFDIGFSMLGVGSAGVLSQLALLADATAFSREQEREADAMGLELMAAAGYQTVEAPKLWENLIEEREADPTAKDASFFSRTHPTTTERQQTLSAQAQSLPGGSLLAQNDYMAQARRLRELMLEDEIALRKPARTLVVLDRLESVDRTAPDLAFFRGEAYRMRARTGDADRARTAYYTAIQNDPDYANAWRGLGRIERASGNGTEARDAFQRYLELEPTAPDAEFIRAFINA